MAFALCPGLNCQWTSLKPKGSHPSVPLSASCALSCPHDLTCGWGTAPQWPLGSLFLECSYLGEAVSSQMCVWALGYSTVVKNLPIMFTEKKLSLLSKCPLNAFHIFVCRLLPIWFADLGHLHCHHLVRGLPDPMGSQTPMVAG